MYTLKTITPEKALEISTARLIDVRSEAEFAEDHPPGAVNVPLFNTDQRIIVGTLFRKKGFLKSFEKGEEFTKKNLDRLLESFSKISGKSLPENLAEEMVRRICDVFRFQGEDAEEINIQPAELEDIPLEPIIIYCWRGGMRSRAVAALLGELGLECLQMADGYKAYRTYVMRSLETAAPPRCVTLRGNTGTGKTLLLRRIARLRPEIVVDLEEMAGHRSSVLGDIGLAPRTKKRFDSLLFEATCLRRPPAVLCEGESRKIGNIEIPRRFYDCMERGPHVLVRASMETRRRYLVEDYVESCDWSPDEFRERLDFLGLRIGSETRDDLKNLFARGDYEAVAEILIRKYYDPLYSHTLERYRFDLEVDSDDLESAAAEILQFYDKIA